MLWHKCTEIHTFMQILIICSGQNWYIYQGTSNYDFLLSAKKWSPCIFPQKINISLKTLYSVKDILPSSQWKYSRHPYFKMIYFRVETCIPERPKRSTVSCSSQVTRVTCTPWHVRTCRVRISIIQRCLFIRSWCTVILLRCRILPPCRSTEQESFILLRRIWMSSVAGEI